MLVNWPAVSEETVVMDNGALVTFTQDKIRVSRSYTHSRGISHAQMRKIIKAG